MGFRGGMMVLAAVICGAGGFAAGARPPVGAASRLDVAGLTPGMAAADAERVLRSGGWSLEPFRDDSWKMTLDKVRARQRGQFVTGASDGLGGWDGRKGDERLEVRLHPTPGGGIVEGVVYRAPLAGRTSARFRSELAQRYGSPTLPKASLYRDGAVWCSAGDSECARGRGGGRLPYIVSAFDEAASGQVRLMLFEGSAAKAAWERQRDAAAGSASLAKPSF